MSESRVIFRGGQVFDGENEPANDVSVVVEGNRITQVTPGPVESGEGDRVIDLAGKTLMPGMIQGHFHAGFGPSPNLGVPPRLGLEAAAPYLGMVAAKNAQTALQTGVTGIIGSSNGDFLDICLREAMIMGLVEGPRSLACTHEFMVSGDYADGANRSWFMGVENPGLTRVVDGVDQVRAATREELGRGCDVVKLSAAPGHGSSGVRDFCFFRKEELEAVAEEAHDRGKLVRAHCPARSAILRCAEAGVDIIDHGDRIDDEGIEVMLKQGASLCPSMLWSVRFLQFAESWDYDLGPFPIGEGFPETREMTEQRLDEVRRDFEYTCEILPKLAKSGINLVVGDDYGFAMMPHGDYVSEYEVYVKQVGIPAIDVLRWATRNGARLMAGPLGLDPGHGTIAEGQLADLLVVDGDPVADISCLRDRIVTIVRDGEFIRDLA